MDPSLVSRLLQIANSAFYSFSSQVESIHEALQLIGLQQVRDLAMATCVISVFEKLPARLVDVSSFWKHSIACGVASALLAEERHDPAPERFFVGGLLHDIGRLIMYLKSPDESWDILRRCEREGQLASVIETDVLGFDHAALGAELISRWGLPVALREMVRCHHEPTKSQLAVLDRSVVHYADFIVSALDLGNSGELYVAPVILEEGRRNLLEDERLEPLVQDLDHRCNQLFAILTDCPHA